MNHIDTILYENSRYDVFTVLPKSPGHHEAISIRSQGKEGVFRDEYDETADIYLMKRGDVPVATMRVNQARRGEMDCEAFYPQEFLHRYRHMINSASRLARSVEQKPSIYLMRQFLRVTFKHQMQDGMRVVLINVHERMISYYVDMGYQLLYGSRIGPPGQPGPVISWTVALADPDFGGLTFPGVRSTVDSDPASTADIPLWASPYSHEAGSSISTA